MKEMDKSMARRSTELCRVVSCSSRSKLCWNAHLKWNSLVSKRPSRTPEEKFHWHAWKHRRSDWSIWRWTCDPWMPWHRKRKFGCYPHVPYHWLFQILREIQRSAKTHIVKRKMYLKKFSLSENILEEHHPIWNPLWNIFSSFFCISFSKILV